MTAPNRSRRFAGAALALVLVAGASGAFLVSWPSDVARATDPPAAGAAPQATPVSVSVVQPKDAMSWDEFSGRLEAVERVEVRSRVAGAVEKVHFREGALVKAGDLLVTIDPAPYQAELDRAQAQATAADARVAFTKNELDRGQALIDSKVVSVSTLDQRTNAHLEAQANLKAAQAAVQTAKLNLGYTDVRAPVAGRVGRLEITVGNLVEAGPGAPVLTNLVSVDPIYASFDVDESAVSRALASLGESSTTADLERIPVEITTATAPKPVRGKLQLVDNQVETRTGTIRLRAVFDNPDGRLIPGQFARVKMGRARTEPVIAINERAVGTDQDKKFVFVVDADNKAAWREVKLGPATDNLRVVVSGLQPGERIVVNGIQRVRPGVLLAPEEVPMDAKGTAANGTGAAKTDIAGG